MSDIQLIDRNRILTTFVIVTLLSAIFWGFNQHNLPVQFSMLLGIIALPFTIHKNPISGNYRFAIYAIIFALLLFWSRSGTLFFVLTAFIALFAIEMVWGKQSLLVVFLIFLASPAFANLSYMWGFSIRMKLTNIAALMLKTAGNSIETSGSIIHMNGETFSVDPACAGLNTLVTSLIICIILIGISVQKTGKVLNLSKSLILLVSTFIAAIISNFVRLLILITFRILPENPMHDVVGILCLIIYVIVPLIFAIKWLNKRQHIAFKHETNQTKLSQNKIFSKKALGILTLLVVVHIALGFQFLKPVMPNHGDISQIQLSGFQKVLTKNGVVKLSNTKAVIYLKPPVSFYKGSHDPRFCWAGSGYEFTQMQLETIDNHPVYTAVLTKGDDKIYTAWWYQSKNTIVADDWDWRLSNIQSKGDYFLVNVNCSNHDALISTISKSFKILL